MAHAVINGTPARVLGFEYSSDGFMLVICDVGFRPARYLASLIEVYYDEE